MAKFLYLFSLYVHTPYINCCMMLFFNDKIYWYHFLFHPQPQQAKLDQFKPVYFEPFHTPGLNDLYSRKRSRDLLNTACCHAAQRRAMKNSLSSCLWTDFSAGNFRCCRLNISHYLSQGSSVSPLSFSLTHARVILTSYSSHLHANTFLTACFQVLAVVVIWFAKSHLCSLSFSALARSGQSWRCFPRHLRETLKYVIQRGQPWWRVFCILRSVLAVMKSLCRVERHSSRSGIRLSAWKWIGSHLLRFCMFRALLQFTKPGVLLHFTVIEGLMWSCISNENVLLHTMSK